MAVTARTWVTGELGTAAKLNTIRDDLLELEGLLGFASVQRGTITLSGVTSNTASIVAVDEDQATCTYQGLSTTEGSGQQDRVMTRVVLTDEDTVTATKGTSTGTVTVGFEVAERNAA